MNIVFILLIVAVGAAVAAFHPANQHRRAALGVFVAALVGLGAASSIAVVPAGSIAIRRVFGAVQPGHLPEGLGFVAPWSQLDYVSVRRATVDFTPNRGEAPSVLAISSDRNTLVVDASLPYRIGPESAWKLIQRIGNQRVIEQTLVLPAARAAVRQGVAKFSWVEASIEKRDDLAEAIRKDAQAAVVADLLQLGLSEAEARGAIEFLPVQLRDVRPDAKVLNAISERVAAEEDLKRQQVLTRIAEQEAERRANEGRGVARLFAELPAGFTSGQIRDVLASLADKQRADALMKAVEQNKVNVIVVPGSQPVSIPIEAGK